MARILVVNILFMVKGDLTITIPNPHKDEIGKELLSRVLKRQKLGRKNGKRFNVVY